LEARHEKYGVGINRLKSLYEMSDRAIAPQNVGEKVTANLQGEDSLDISIGQLPAGYPNPAVSSFKISKAVAKVVKYR
jgi:hypothetical protein